MLRVKASRNVTAMADEKRVWIDTIINSIGNSVD